MAANASENTPILQMEHISKSFPGVQALRDVHFDVKPGEVHVLVGENGAGKSTLIKILGGVYHPDEGAIILDGQQVRIDSPRYARNLGISIIHQELHLSPNLSVAENIFMGREPQTVPGWIDYRKMRQDTRALLAQVGATFSPVALAETLSVAQQQLVEIARALSENARILVMDEPTAALSERETQKLFEIIHTLRERGIAIIYISHRMAEIGELADRVTVLRDGQHVATLEKAEATPEKLIQLMVGRSLHDLYVHSQQEADKAGEVVLDVRDLADEHGIGPVSLQVRKGEIVGLAGLIGSGRTELARMIFGADRHRQGEIYVAGRPVRITRPVDAIRAGIGLVPENRKEQGLFLELAVRENITINVLPRLSVAGFIQEQRVRRLASDYIDQLRIRLASASQLVKGLSGGNQQKVVLAKWLTLQPAILLLDEPTRGVDVGAKAEIYRIMSRLASNGVAILMISSELPEILGMSDRILVMHEGKIVADLAGRSTTQEEIMVYATGMAAHSTPHS